MTFLSLIGRPAIIGVCFLILGLTGCATQTESGSGAETLQRGDASTPSPAARSAGETEESYQSVMRVAKKTEAAGDRSTAIGLLQRAHEIDPSQAEPLLQLAGHYKELGHERQAEEAYRRLVEIEPENPEHLLEHGLLLLRRDQIFQARTRFLKALRMQKDPRALNAAGVTYDLRGQHGEAQGYYRDALLLDPVHLPSLGNLGLSLALAGDHGQAIEVLETAVTLPEAGPGHRHMLATAYGLSGDMVAASRVTGVPFDETVLKQHLESYGVAAASP